MCSIHGTLPFWMLYVCTHARFFLLNGYFYNIFSMSSLLQRFHRLAHLYMNHDAHKYNTLFRPKDLDTVAAHRLTPSSPVGLAIKKHTLFHGEPWNVSTEKNSSTFLLLLWLPVTTVESVTGSQPPGQWRRYGPSRSRSAEALEVRGAPQAYKILKVAVGSFWMDSVSVTESSMLGPRYEA
jgi:hypothetical protein